MFDRKRGLALTMFMRNKILAFGLAALFCSIDLPARASDDSGPLTVALDVVVVRPGCLAATLVGSVLFVVSLPFAAASKSVKKTAHTLVVNPARATFTRPVGDMEPLKHSSEI